MRVHLPALLAWVSAVTYVACGSSDPSKVDQEGGAAGEGGETTGAGGAQSGGGSKSGGGTNSSAAGEGGEAALGGMPSTGTGGAEGGAVSVPGGAGGEGGGPEQPVDPNAFPEECPGTPAEYVALDGGPEPDTFTGLQLDETLPNGAYSQVFARGFAGDDTFEYNNAGADCLLGGDGDDDFSAPGEYGSVLVGGGGADVFHLLYVPNNNPSTIVDMSSEDTIGISQASFPFLAGDPGATVYETQLYSVPGYEAGTGSVPANEGAALVYDPATGSLWRDDDRGLKGSSEGDAVELLKIANPGSYTFDIGDFVLDD